MNFLDKILGGLGGSGGSGGLPGDPTGLSAKVMEMDPVMKMLKSQGIDPMNPMSVYDKLSSMDPGMKMLKEQGLDPMSSMQKLPGSDKLPMGEQTEEQPQSGKFDFLRKFIGQ